MSRAIDGSRLVWTWSRRASAGGSSMSWAGEGDALTLAEELVVSNKQG